MPHILKNKTLEIHIDLPLENYNFSRFDWTGKIVKVKFQGNLVSGVERSESKKEHYFGKGLYNEFGIDSALGYEATDMGSWFQKIGIGLLRKDDSQYFFSKKYEIKPAEFQVLAESNRILIECKPKYFNGYCYLLKKEIKLQENSFTIQYYLQNTGEKEIKTSEYVHNFISINNELIGKNYVLKFPFQLHSEKFGEIVNPEGKVEIGCNEIGFGGCPKEQFFYSNLSGSEKVKAEWELVNLKSKLGIRETGSFQTHKVNLWGWKHVVSPELFFDICIQPGQSAEWARTYNVYKIR